MLRGEKHNEYGPGPTLPLPLPLNSLVIPSQSRQLPVTKGSTSIFPSPAHSVLPNWKHKADDEAQVHMPHQGGGSIEKLHPTSSRSAHIPVSLQLIFLGLVSFHCLKQKAFCEKTKVGSGGVAPEGTSGKIRTRGQSLQLLLPQATSPWFLLEGASGLTPIISVAGSKPKSGKTALGDGADVTGAVANDPTSHPHQGHPLCSGGTFLSVLKNWTVRFWVEGLRLKSDFPPLFFGSFAQLVSLNESPDT